MSIAGYRIKTLWGTRGAGPSFGRFADPQEVREQGHPRRARLLGLELNPVEGRPLDRAGEALPVLGGSGEGAVAGRPGRGGGGGGEGGLLAETLGEARVVRPPDG